MSGCNVRASVMEQYNCEFAKFMAQFCTKLIILPVMFLSFMLPNVEC